MLLRQRDLTDTDDMNSESESSLKKVLIIDDDEDILNWFRMLHRKESPYSFHFLQDEIEVLRAIVEIRPDLIILDICLTHIDGKKLSEIIRIASSYHIPILHISTQEQSSHEVPENTFMRKPLERKAVDTKIRNLLRIH